MSGVVFASAKDTLTPESEDAEEWIFQGLLVYFENQVLVCLNLFFFSFFWRKLQSHGFWAVEMLTVFPVQFPSVFGLFAQMRPRCVCHEEEKEDLSLKSPRVEDQ